MQTKNIFFFLIILILSSSFVQADTSAPSPSEELKGRAKVEGLEDTHSPISYKKITLNAEMLSREIAQTTGLALNPILCMSVLGGYYYFTTPRASFRTALAFIASILGAVDPSFRADLFKRHLWCGLS